MKVNEIIERNFHKISDEYKEFCIEKSKCQECAIFNDYQTGPAMSEGNGLDPTFMIIGESLGRDEAEQYRPFIGKAGQRLRTELRKHKKVFNQNTAIISNIIPCRPQNNKFPQNSSIVYECMYRWLIREIDMLKPKVIITLGGNAYKSLHNVKQAYISENRGDWRFSYELRAWTFATYHPSYVIRCQRDQSKKHVEIEFEQDFLKVVNTGLGIIRSDHRMKITDEEWQREKAINGRTNR